MGSNEKDEKGRKKTENLIRFIGWGERIMTNQRDRKGSSRSGIGDLSPGSRSRGIPALVKTSKYVDRGLCGFWDST
jgi:hypothetical protein